MFILDAVGNIRTILFTIDQVAFSLIDNAYNLIVVFSKAEFFKSDAITGIMNSTYVVIGLFALFKMAVLLVNAIVSPDRLFDKDKGFVVIIRNVVIMFALLIFVPILFKESMNLQSTIVEGNYVNRLFGLNVPDNYNPGDMFKAQAISALVHPNEAFAVYKNNKYEITTGDNGTDKYCKDDSTHCKEAIEDYNKALFGTEEQRKHMFSTLLDHMGDYVKDDFGNGKEKIYVYDYSMFLTFIVGIAITYLLILFCFDLAERVIKLAILEIVSPLFIVTYIDPKSAKSGPFSNWLKEVGSTYVSLYIRLAALALIIILTTLWQQRNTDINLGGWGNIVFILSILIFAKNFPKWLGGLIGVKDFDGGLGGLGKRLGSAALVGGMLTKAGHTALGVASGAKSMVSENRRNRNALRKQARIDSGTTHGKQGKEFRKKQSGGYFTQRKALHDARKQAYKDAGVNLLGKDSKGKNAVGRNLGQIGASIAAGAIVGGQAGIKADNIKGTLTAAKGAASQFGQELGFKGKTIGGAISYGLGQRTEKLSNAWGNESERYDAKQEAEKAEKAIRYRATGINYTHGAEKGKIATGVGETKKVIEREFKNASGGGKFELKTDADKLAKQFAVTTGSENIDKVVNDKGEVLSYKFTGEDGKVITKTTDEIKATCGGIMKPEGVDNFLKSSYVVQQNAVSAYNDNIQAQANAVSSYNQAQQNAQASANEFSSTLSSNKGSVEDALKAAGITAGLSALGSSITDAIGPINTTLEKLKNDLKVADDSKKGKINSQISLLSKLQESAENNSTFTTSAIASMNQLKSIVASQQELAPIVNSVDGNTEAEKLQTLSRNITDIDKKLKAYEKDDKK